MKLNRPVISAFILSLLIFAACKDQDLRLINKVKTFGPRWGSLNEKLNYVNRNLNILESRLEHDFNEIENMLPTIPDSLRDRRFRSNLGEYEKSILWRDSLRAHYNSRKKAYVDMRYEFNDWEKEVMDGSVEYEAGLARLDDYAVEHQKLDLMADSLQVDLKRIVEIHNSVLDDLVKRMGVYTNYDIQLY